MSLVLLVPGSISIMFAMLIHDAFRDAGDAGIYLNSHTDRGVFNLRRLHAKTKVTQILVRELLFADDCTTVAHSLQHIKKLMGLFCHGRLPNALDSPVV